MPAARRGLVACLAAAALGGCGSFSQFSLNPIDWFSRSAPPPPAPLVPIANPIPVRVLWQVNVGKAELATFTPAVAGGSVFAAAADGTVVRLDAASGRQLWRVRLPNALSGGVGADEKLVVVGSSEGEVIALDADGATLWRARVSSEVLAAPEVAGDVVVVRSADSRIFALDARDGRRRWVFQRAAPALAVRSPAGVVVAGGFVFAGFSGGKLVALALANGGQRWEGTVALTKGTTELERVSDVVGLPWIGEREGCAVAYQGRVACFNLGNGSQLWARDISSSAGLGVDARSVYVSEDRGAVAAFDRAAGRSFWRQDKLAHRRLTAPLPVGAEVVFGDVEGQVHLLDRDSGAFVGRVATDGTAIRSPPVELGRGFLIQTTGGNLYALATR
ncbi:MAG: outer membrane protein assembly factor BamB [Burkholderiales bacterium]